MQWSVSQRPVLCALQVSPCRIHRHALVSAPVPSARRHSSPHPPRRRPRLAPQVYMMKRADVVVPFLVLLYASYGFGANVVARFQLELGTPKLTSPERFFQRRADQRGRATLRSEQSKPFSVLGPLFFWI